MPAKSKPVEEKKTFIEEARRKQIIDAALQTIAEQGYTQTSFAEIAKSLGITKGLIAYHFNGKHDLITSAIHTILNRQGAYIRGRVEEESKGSDKLRVYIEASFEYISQNRSQFVALKARMRWMDINQERHHAFAGYEGMVTMVQEIHKALFNPVWQQVRTRAPWDTEDTLLTAEA